jgi:hypothetical protein
MPVTDFALRITEGTITEAAATLIEARGLVSGRDYLVLVQLYRERLICPVCFDSPIPPPCFICPAFVACEHTDRLATFAESLFEED